MQADRLGAARPPYSAHADTCDGALLAEVASGCEPAFEELRRRYRASVEWTCRSLLRAGAEEDCAQEVFTRVWQKAHLFDASRGSVAAWLFTLTRNVARNFGAKRIAEPMALDPADGQLTPEPTVERFWLEGALEQLPAKERQAIELAYFADLSQAQIAAALGVPLGTIKTWTRRGLNRLAGLLAEEAGS